jgi:MATE family multidrug resistance protein
LDSASLAAHQIALNLASLTFMVPLGISSAAAVRVGHRLGAGDPIGAGRAGWSALACGLAFMACAAIAFLSVPDRIASLYSRDPDVIRISVALLALAAAFQLFDGCQIVVSGALRGAGNTRTPMLCNLGFYWLIGLPTGYLLCFQAGWGVVGLWCGLSLGLILIGCVLLLVWRRTVSELAQTIRKEGRPIRRPDRA